MNIKKNNNNNNDYMKNRVTFVVVEIPDCCATPVKYRRSNTAKHILLQQIVCSL